MGDVHWMFWGRFTGTSLGGLEGYLGICLEGVRYMFVEGKKDIEKTMLNNLKNILNHGKHPVSFLRRVCIPRWKGRQMQRIKFSHEPNTPTKTPQSLEQTSRCAAARNIISIMIIDS